MILSLENDLVKLMRKATLVNQFGTSLQTVVDQLIETMRWNQLLSLSGPEVSVPLRIITIDVSRGTDPDRLFVLVNPEVIVQALEMEEIDEECPCLSGVRAFVARPKRVVVGFCDCGGKGRELRFESLEAHLICHQLDHLEGLLFVDHLGLLARSRLLRSLKQGH